ncbi:16077_t:CDS:2, partial [Acaulospora morrowiae]
MEIYPDHFYGGVPVFKPTWAQFKDFRTFVSAVKSYGYESGIIKIIPPTEWRETLPKDLSPQLSKIIIKNPCKQIVQRDTTVGYYVVRNIESERDFTVKEWADLCERPEHATPFPKSKHYTNSSVSDYLPLRKKKKHAGKSNKKNIIVKRNQPSSLSAPKIAPRKNDTGITPTPPEAPKTRISESTSKETTKIFLPDRSLHGQPSINDCDSHKDNNLSSQECSDESEIEEEEVILTSEQMGVIAPANRPPSLSPESASDPMLMEIEEAYEKFDYHSVNQRPYDDDNYISELAANYWKTIMYNHPYYGADMAGTLFTKRTSSWNVNSLDNLLNTIDPIPGVNDAYLYFGMWKACFPWHVEDKDLYSINYIHFGAPKHWYAISPKRADQFESHMRGWFGSDSKNCSEFLRHKEFLASPRVLDRAPIQFNYTIQREGEFIITFPRGYHAGFNLGFNCAESVNFAFEDWIPHGINAKSCDCRQDSVRIDVKALFGHLLDPNFVGPREGKKASKVIAATSTLEPSPGKTVKQTGLRKTLTAVSPSSQKNKVKLSPNSAGSSSSSTKIVLNAKKRKHKIISNKI